MVDKIVLNKALGTYDVTQINNNFDKIAQEFNEKVLYRQPPNGTPNTMKNNLDMNGFRILNLPSPGSDNEPARLKDVSNAIAGLSGQTANLVQFDATPFNPATNVQGALVNLENKIKARAVSITDYGADPTGVLDSSAAIQTAINTAGVRGGVFYPVGTYKIANTITLLPQQRHYGDLANIYVNANVTAFSKTTDGYPGRISFDGLIFQGGGGTSKAISITNNTPFITIRNCAFSGFLEAVRLANSYGSHVSDCYFVGNTYGLILLDESHLSSLTNVLFDGNTYVGLGINGDSVRGKLNTTPTHNITLTGCGFQNSEFGLWAESALELNLIGTYHEGNTKCDLRIGVNDSGAYNRACYNVTVDTWQSSSACASGKNIIIEHTVNANLRGLAFNSGTSATATVFQVDGYSDFINADYHRVQHGTFTATAPFDFPAGRVMLACNGRRYTPWTMKGNRYGSPNQVIGDTWGTYTSGGRPLFMTETTGSGYDLGFKSYDLERHYDGAGNEKLNIDHLNFRVNTAYLIQPYTDNLLPLGNAGNRWTQVYAATGTINTSDERDKTEIEDIEDAVLRAWAKVEWVKFKFKDAVEKKGKDGARWHFGVIAQRVKEAFESEGLDPFAYGILCYDEWEDEVGETGEVIRSAGNRYGIRYEEALALECAYLRSKLGV